MLRTRLLVLLATVMLAFIVFLISKYLSEERGQVLRPEYTFNEEDESILQWKDALATDAIQENSATFADSLAVTYLELGYLDSAAKYFDMAVTLDPNLIRIEKAGEANYQSFSLADDPVSMERFGQKAKEYFEVILSSNPSRADLKIKIALFFLTTGQSRQGVEMLEDVLAEDPQSKEALFQSGLFSYQSGDYSLAVSYFEELTRIDSSNAQAHFNLGLCYRSLGFTAEAREQFEIVKNLDPGPDVESIVDSFLEDLD